MKFIYVITNVVTQKVYVGQTKNFSNRKAQHLYAARNDRQQPLYRSMRKHGIENFTFEVIEECVDELIDERERHWVAHFDSFNSEKGYNLTCGGEGTSGYNFTDEVKNVLREKARNRKHTDAARHKISEANSNRKHSLETKQKMSVSQTGEKNAMFGKRGERAIRAKLTKKQADEIRERLTNGERVGLLAHEFDVSRQTIRRVKLGLIYV